MNVPDYSSYDEQQLRQVLEQTGTQLHPEHVSAIEARLAQLQAARAAAGVESPASADNAPEPAEIAGRWRRLIAFALDTLILGLVGLCIGFFLYDHLVALGAWGRAIGFPISLLYFALTDSRINLGQSPGKMALGLKVVRHDGSLLSVPAALLRAIILSLPFFFRIDIDYSSALFWPLCTLATLACSAGLITLYLLIFNRPARQSLHDLAVGSYVVRAGRSAPLPHFAPLWRGHKIVAAVLLMLALAWVPLSAHLLAGNRTLEPLLQLQRAVAHVPHVRNAGVNSISSRQVGDTAHAWTTLVILAQLDTRALDENQLADQLAQLALERPADGPPPETIQVILSYGYDIGIASRSMSNRYAHTPAEWRARLATPARQ